MLTTDTISISWYIGPRWSPDASETSEVLLVELLVERILRQASAALKRWSKGPGP